MRRVAGWLLFIGIGGLVLPLLHIQFIVLSIFGHAQTAVAIGCTLLGGVLMFGAPKN